MHAGLLHAGARLLAQRGGAQSCKAVCVEKGEGAPGSDAGSSGATSSFLAEGCSCSAHQERRGINRNQDLSRLLHQTCARLCLRCAALRCAALRCAALRCAVQPDAGPPTPAPPAIRHTD